MTLSSKRTAALVAALLVSASGGAQTTGAHKTGTHKRTRRSAVARKAPAGTIQELAALLREYPGEAPVVAAIETGFAKAFLTILDTHVTTVVSCLFLFLFLAHPSACPLPIFAATRAARGRLR